MVIPVEQPAQGRAAVRRPRHAHARGDRVPARSRWSRSAAAAALAHHEDLRRRTALTDFVCCLGYRGEMIKQYFLDYHALRSDVTVSLAQRDVELRARASVEDWTVTLVDTGEDSMTGARVKRVEHVIGDADLFLVTYGDGLADVDIAALLEFHRSHGKLATRDRRASAGPLRRAGARRHRGEPLRREAARRPLISGGFFVFDRARARPPLARSPLRARARAARGARGRRRAAASTTTTASGSAPTRCATSSCCAGCGIAARRRGGCGTTASSTRPSTPGAAPATACRRCSNRPRRDERQR